jgi:hypothetical protein
METLKTDEHLVWMKIIRDLTNDSKNISVTITIENIEMYLTHYPIVFMN